MPTCGISAFHSLHAGAAWSPACLHAHAHANSHDCTLDAVLAKHASKQCEQASNTRNTCALARTHACKQLSQTMHARHARTNAPDTIKHTMHAHHKYEPCTHRKPHLTRLPCILWTPHMDTRTDGSGRTHPSISASATKQHPSTPQPRVALAPAPHAHAYWRAGAC